MGVRAVLDVRHEGDPNLVTERQIREIFPHLTQQLCGNERLILDFGCGPGRFTSHLAKAIKGRAIGVDPIQSLLDAAPAAPNVRYALAKNGKIPQPNSSLDVVWVCLVVGGIPATSLDIAVSEIRRVLKPGGLLFLIENTTPEKPDSPNWKYRSVDEYRALFNFTDLVHLHDYFDFDERISILAGRKCRATAAMASKSRN
jgi:SAM-dependent methyltransferase